MTPPALRILNRPWVWLSVTLLLYCMGLGCVLVAYAQEAVRHTRLSVPVWVEFRDNVEDAAIFAWQQQLKQRSEVDASSVRYISREEALENWDPVEMGISREEVLLAGENPLPNALQFTLSATYEGKHAVVAKALEQDSLVAAVYYTPVPLDDWSQQLRQAILLLLVVLLFFGIIVLTLLRSHVRLAWREPSVDDMDDKERRRWYRRQSVRNGLMSAVVAVVGMWGTRWWLEQQMTFNQHSELEFWTSLTTAVVLLLGAALPWWAAQYRPSVPKNG